MGNVASVLNMIHRIGGEAFLSSSADQIRSAAKLILPGVGAFDAGVNALKDAGLDTVIREAVVQNGAMILGICLGMQLLMETSEEGVLPGLGLVPGRVRKISVQDHGLRVPHMGWNKVKPQRPSVLFDPGDDSLRYYFVHSYFVQCDDPKDVAGIACYGHDFTAALERGNILGVQFHPEKSHRFGMALFKRYLES
jgi:glutamine amidotransferase